ncbi:hypothetical protein CEXT_291621 [Caerostris extrusa]|uniref:Uncharacterized protein n=1 Tax=Caerostris extrusa TaxID=172846 RepID=A0AAV4W7S4_CAEEX|nr:hypothetical protein CEXT_291621 [Caerostris extrusa]
MQRRETSLGLCLVERLYTNIGSNRFSTWWKTQNLSKVLRHHNKCHIGYLKQTRAFAFCLKSLSLRRRVKGREDWLAAARTEFSTRMPSA